jgi:TatA/E family protein of Tat protein translocase
MGQLGFQELLVIFIIALLVFGPKKLPELGKSLGKGLREFKRATNELKATWDDNLKDAENEISSTAQDFRDIQKDVNTTMNEAAEPDLAAPASPVPPESDPGMPAAPEPDPGMPAAPESDPGMPAAPEPDSGMPTPSETPSQKPS